MQTTAKLIIIRLYQYTNEESLMSMEILMVDLGPKSKKSLKEIEARMHLAHEGLPKSKD